VPSSELVAVVADAGANIFHSYEYAAENYGLATDVMTAGCINTASDTLAQLRERSAPNGTVGRKTFESIRTLRLATFGLFDGAVSHIWFIGLDGVVGEGQGLADTLVKTAADAMVYTPLWCAWFLAAMCALESPTLSSVAGRIRSVPSIWRSDWAELLRGNVSFFLPLTGIFYGFVPRDERVLAFGLAGFIYTIILSLWNESRAGKIPGPNSDGVGGE